MPIPVPVWGMQEAKRRLAVYGSVFLVRGYSPGVATRFPDNFFDFMYIDARHDYASVLSDLLEWWPKLSPDGIMAGHDYLVSWECWCGRGLS